MSTPNTSRVHPDSLDPTFRSIVYEEFGKGQDLKPLLFGEESSDRDQEKFGSITGIGDFTEHVGTIDYDGPDDAYSTTVVHKEFSKGCLIERKLLDDEQFGVIKQIFSLFGEAARNTRQKDMAQPFNNAFILDTEFNTRSEGVALCSNSHTTPRDGVDATTGFDNLGTAAFSATAIAAVRYQMRKLKMLNGEFIDRTPDLLLVPVELEDEALVINKTAAGLDTAGKDYNPQAGRFEIISTTRLTSASNWFAINKEMMKKHLRWIDRIPFETDRMEKFDTFNFHGRGYMRYRYVLDPFWQWVVGFQVS